MELFRVTFGQQYDRDPHQVFKLAHPDGWLTVEAPSYGRARDLVCALLGSAWCDLYTPESWAQIEHLFPAGELARIRVGDTPEVLIRALAGV
jgi:hypothetical protein